MAEQANVIIDNVKEIRRAMTKYAPEVKKALDKANREAAAPMISMAKRNFVDIPMRNWVTRTNANGDQKPGWISKKDNRDLTYSAAVAQKGIKIKQRGRAKRSPWSGVLQIRNESAIGSIFELAGRKNDPSTPQGIQFIKNLQDITPVKVKGLSRGIWKAIKEYPVKKYTDQVVANYEEAEKQLQRELDAMRSSV